MKTFALVLYRALVVILLLAACSSLEAIVRYQRLQALMLLESPARPAPKREGGLVPAGVVDGGDTEEKRFTAGGLKLPDGTAITILEDSATGATVYVTPGGAAAVQAPLVAECPSPGIPGARVARR